VGKKEAAGIVVVVVVVEEAAEGGVPAGRSLRSAGDTATPHAAAPANREDVEAMAAGVVVGAIATMRREEAEAAAVAASNPRARNLQPSAMLAWWGSTTPSTLALGFPVPPDK
jgi:hypothetical protein